MPFPIDSKYIELAEQELNIQFPSSFKKKMSNENGGDIVTNSDVWQLIPFFDKSDKKRISRTCNHIIKETNQMKKWPNFPDFGIAIATNGFGDCLILQKSNSDESQLSEEVFVWLHETGEVIKLANTIKELLKD